MATAQLDYWRKRVQENIPRLDSTSLLSLTTAVEELLVTVSRESQDYPSPVLYPPPMSETQTTPAPPVIPPAPPSLEDLRSIADAATKAAGEAKDAAAAATAASAAASARGEELGLDLPPEVLKQIGDASAVATIAKLTELGALREGTPDPAPEPVTPPVEEPVVVDQAPVHKSFAARFLGE